MKRGSRGLLTGTESATQRVTRKLARFARRLIPDIDSSESPVHGGQEQSAYNGHFESVCYHPLFVFNQHSDCLAATLRPPRESGTGRLPPEGANVAYARLDKSAP